MSTLSERISEIDQKEYRGRAQGLMRDPRFREELLRYLVSVGDTSLIQELYGIESPYIAEQRVEIIRHQIDIILPNEHQIYVGNSRKQEGFDLERLSREELSFLIQAFIPDANEREYIVGLIFYQHNFLNQGDTDFMDLLAKSENIFRVTFQKKNQVLKLVTREAETELPIAANDSVFENPYIDTLEKMEAGYERQQYIADRIEAIEPGYYEYLHSIYVERLHFVESLFSQMVMFLAEYEENHIWALDPKNHTFHIPPAIQSKIDLIASICEFHRSFDPHYPLLHTLIEGTVRSWILIYKGFSSPAEQLRTR